MNNDPLLNDKEKQILAQRARLIATEKKDLTAVSGTNTNLLVFHVGEEQKYALPYDAIDKVIVHKKIRPIPGVNPLFLGLLYHNSEIWTVIDLRQLLGCKFSDSLTHFILLDEHQRRYALCVGTIVGSIIYDESIDLIQFSLDEAKQQSFVRTVYSNEIAVLDKELIVKTLESIQVDWNKP